MGNRRDCNGESNLSNVVTKTFSVDLGGWDIRPGRGGGTGGGWGEGTDTGTGSGSGAGKGGAGESGGKTIRGRLMKGSVVSGKESRWRWQRRVLVSQVFDAACDACSGALSRLCGLFAGAEEA